MTSLAFCDVTKKLSQVKYLRYLAGACLTRLDVRDYDNPPHRDVVDRYLRRMGDKTIPDEALSSLESFYPP